MNSWERWEEAVLSKLDEHSEFHKEHREHLTKLHVELAELRVKASLWGAFSGAVVALAVVLVKLFRS